MMQPGERPAGRRADAVLGVPGLADPAGAALRRHHRPAAHRAPGHELLRRPPSGSAPTRSSASARSTTSSRSSTSAATRSGATSMDRTVIEDTESSLDLATHGWQLLTTRSGSASAPPRRTSAPLHPAPSVGQRRAADPPQGLWGCASHACSAASTAASPARCSAVNYLASTCWSRIALLFLLYFPFAQQAAQPAGPDRRGAVLHRDGVATCAGPATSRIRHAPDLRAST